MSSSLGSGSKASTARPTVDDGDSKPPSFSRNRPSTSKSKLRLNTPQADEGPDGEEAENGVAALPQRSSPEASRKWSSPSEEGTVVGFTEDGPIRRAAVSDASPPARVPTAHQPSAYRAGSAMLSSAMSSPAAVRAEPTTPRSQRSPASVRASRPVGMPTQASLAARRSSANNNRTDAAAGVPVVSGSADADPNETVVNTEADSSVSSDADKSIPKKYLYWGGALIVVLVVVLAVVIPVLVKSSKNDAPPPAPVVENSSPTMEPPSPDDSPPSTSPPSSSPVAGVEPISALATVAQRGSLKCGISLRAGFGIANDGEYSGFDVDLVSTWMPCL